MKKHEILTAIVNERQRQIELGHTIEIDDTRTNMELPRYAAVLAAGRPTAAVEFDGEVLALIPVNPWSRADRELIAEHSYERRLVVAAALLIAELERLGRAKGDI